MQLLALNPTTNITRVSNVPALNLTLAGAAPETTVITATISNVPALSIVLTPPAPTTNITRVSDGVAAAIALNALAPETTHIVPGLTTSDVPALNLSLNALAPSSLRELISEVPVKDFVITGRAPTTSDPSAVVETTRTGGGRGSKGRAKSKYPRKVVIDGVVYVVQSAAEERRLLQQHREKVEADALLLAVSDAPEKEVRKARVRVKRAQARIEATDTREAEWLAQLLAEDEEILMVLH